MILEFEEFSFGHVKVIFPEYRRQEFDKLTPESQEAVMDLTQTAVTNALNLSMRVIEMEIAHLQDAKVNT